MLGKFSTALQNAVDVLAPPPPPHEDFAYHWKKLMKHYLDVTAEKNVPVESTNIPARLDQLLKILIKEDEELIEHGHPGPCMEYLLQHNLLNLLATLAGSDDPSGLRQTVLQFIAKFLTNIKTPVLGHTSVFPPLQRIVAQCEKTNGPNDIHEVQFLLRLTAMVRRNPQLVPIFTSNIEHLESPERRRDSCSSDATSCISSTATDCSSTPQNNALFAPLATSGRAKSVRLLPVETLSASTSSSDDKSLVVDEPAQFPLLDAVIPFLFSEDCNVKLKACQTIMLLCSLPEDKAADIIVSDTLLLSRLSTHLADLFHEIPDTTELSAIDELHVSWGLEAEHCETGLKQLSSFLSWFDFCDQLMAESHSTIAAALANEIKLKFLIELFTPDILSQSLAVSILTKCYKMASSTSLNKVFGSWLIEEGFAEPDQSNKKYSVKNTLFSNWNNRKTDLALETLRFFESVLEKGDLVVINNFIFEYVSGQNYLDKAMPDEVLNKNNETGTRIESIINSFIDIIPIELRSSDSNLYEQYIAESQRQYRSVLEGKKLDASEEVLDNRLDVKFFEGPFLKAMFEALANMPYQPYEINLELTGIVSKICLRAEKDLSKYLLESTVCRFVPEAKSLYKILSQTASLLISSISSVPNYLNVLKLTRARLISDDLSTTQNDEFWSSSFENLVVLEELSKELAAIAFVKYKHSANQLLSS